MSDGWGGDAVLVTERLTLRPFALDDLPIYRAMCADPVVMEFLGGLWSAERTQESMLGANRRLANDGYGMVAVERRSDGEFLGAASASNSGIRTTSSPAGDGPTCAGRRQSSRPAPRSGALMSPVPGVPSASP